MNMGAGKIAGSDEAGDSPPVRNKKKKKYLSVKIRLLVAAQVSLLVF